MPTCAWVRKPRQLCPVCGQTDIFAADIHGIQFQQCRACQHTFRATPNPVDYTRRALPPVYPRERLETQLAFLEPVLRDGTTILELGCGDGTLGAEARKRYRVGRYDGLEVSTDAERAAAHLDRVFQSWDDLRGQTYQVAIASHVLEHLERPGDAVGQLSRHLTPDGALFIEVPNGSGHPRLSLDFNPGHLHFFSSLSLATLCARYDLEVTTIRSGCRESSRYPDSFRVLARPRQEPALRGDELSRGLPELIVWGAGGSSAELLCPYFDITRIRYFVDNGHALQGRTIQGRPVHAPERLTRERDATVLIATLDHEEVIRTMLRERFERHVSRVLSLRELLDDTAREPLDCGA